MVVVAGSALADLSGPAPVIRPPSVQLALPQNVPREIRDAQRRSRQPNMTARVSSDPHIGVFLTILGGLLVGVGGITNTMRRAEWKDIPGTQVTGNRRTELNLGDAFVVINPTQESAPVGSGADPERK